MAGYDWIRVPEAARLLGVSPRSVYALIERGELPHLPDPIRFDRARLVAWIEERMAAPAAATEAPDTPARKPRRQGMSEKLWSDSAGITPINDPAALRELIKRVDGGRRPK